MECEDHQVGAEAGHGIDDQEFQRTQRGQHGNAERVQRQHVEQQVPEAGVRNVGQEHAATVLAPRDLVGDEEERPGAPAALLVQRAEAEQADDHVDGDQRQDHRAARTAAR